MNELYVRFFLAELRKAGFSEAAYDKEQDRVVISPECSRFYVTYEDSEYLIHYDKESRTMLAKVSAMRNMANMVTSAWEHSAPMRAENLEVFRKLLEWNGVVLAARDDSDRGLYFVTWQRCADRKSVENGYYTDSIADVMRNFIGRSGLYPKEILFDREQVDLIRRAIEYRLEHDGELYPDTENALRRILSNLEGEV